MGLTFVESSVFCSDSLASGGDSSSVEIVEADDSMSECRHVYFSVLISSSSGALNATFFAEGNMGFDCASPRLTLRVRGMGPLDRIDVVL